MPMFFLQHGCAFITSWFDSGLSGPLIISSVGDGLGQGRAKKRKLRFLRFFLRFLDFGKFAFFCVFFQGKKTQLAFFHGLAKAQNIKFAFFRFFSKSRTKHH